MFNGLPFAPLLAQTEAELVDNVGQLGSFPIYVLSAYLLLLLALGCYGWWKSKSGEEDYYLAGRNQGWIVSSLTIMATFFSSFALLGAPGMVYRDGVVFALFALNVPVGGLTVYLIGGRIWKLGRKFGFVTPGDLVADYYGSKYGLRILVAAAGFLYAIPYVVMQIQAGGIISQKLFSEESFAIGAIVLATITTLYIMIGGMRSVAWTDVVQGGMLIVGMLIGGMAMFLVFDGPSDFAHRVSTELPESSQTAPGNSGIWEWSKLMTLVLLASSGSMIQPAQWMRYYAARNLQALRRSAVIFAIALTSCFLLGVMLIGLAGQVLYPLAFSTTSQVAETELQLDSAIPAELSDHIHFDGKSLSIQWNGRNRPQLTKQHFRRLAALNPASHWKESVTQLESQYGEILSGKLKPKVAPNSKVDPDTSDGAAFDAILIVVLNEQMPSVLGKFGALFASLMIVAIMAASMSTADSNLHALSAILTRDVYDQFVRPQATETERVWVGRTIIVLATTFAVFLVISGQGKQSAAGTQIDILNMIAQMGFVAIAFTAQLLPIAIDVLYIRRGTRAGAICGLGAGLLTAFLTGQLFPVFVEMTGIQFFNMMHLQIKSLTGLISIDGAAWGLLVNIPIFILISAFTKPVDKEITERYKAIVEGRGSTDS